MTNVETIAEEVKQLSPDGQKLIKAIVSGDVSSLVDPESLQATTNLVIRLTDQLDQLKNKQKEVNEMLHNLFDNDAELVQLTDTLNGVQQQCKARKMAIAATGLYIDLNVKVADLKEDIKMVTESLNTHLLNYYQITGSTSFDVTPTVEREFTVRARVKGDAKRRRNAPVVGQIGIDGAEVRQ